MDIAVDRDTEFRENFKMLNKEQTIGPKITWQQLKDICEKAGVKDDDQLDTVYITWGEVDALECVRDDDFGWQIILDCDC